MNRNKIILCLLMTLLFCHVLIAQSTNFRALVVGISDYPGTDDDIIINVVNDANDMAYYLQYYQGWNSSNIEVKLNDQATASNITSYISNMPNSIGTGEVFFYSGHGIYDDNDNKGLATYSGIISPDQLQGAFGSNYNQYCCILQACYSGVFKYNMTKGEILTSSNDNQMSFADGPGGHSMYGHYILEGLKNNQADPTAGHAVSASELNDYAASKAQTYAWNHGRNYMFPQYKSNFGVFNFQNLKTTSGTPIDDELWDTITLSGDVTIPTGITIFIPDGANINLNGHNIFPNGGTVIISDAANMSGAILKRDVVLKGIYSSVQAACDAITTNEYGHGYEVQIKGSISGNISIANKYNVHFYGTGSNSINGTLSITNCESCSFNGFTAQKISLSGCVLPLLQGISVTSGSGNESLYAYNCTNFYYSGGTITYIYGNGITLNQSSTSTINESNDYTLFYNNNRGINTQSGSIVDVDNVHFCSNNYDLVANAGTDIDANGCWFLNSTPITQGNVETLSNQNFTDCGSMGKIAAGKLAVFSSESDPSMEEFVQINNKNFELSKKVRADIECNGSYDAEKYRGNYTDVVNSFNNFINKYPSSEYAKTALVSAVHIYRTLKDYEGMNNFLQTIMADKNLANESSLAKRFMIEYYTAQKDYTSAIKTADEIISSKDTDLICDALYAKGMLYQYSMDKKSGAIECYTKILKEYPDNSLVTLAETELEFLGVKVERGQKETELSKIDNLEFGSSNYPNPFNPTTSISYTLPEEGRVQIKVFDALGRELTTLLDDVVSSGKHTIDWNGSNAASGIYFYSISFKGQILYKKMLMIK